MFWLTTKCKYNKVLSELVRVKDSNESLRNENHRLRELKRNYEFEIDSLLRENEKLNKDLKVEKSKTKSGFQKGHKPWNKGVKFEGGKQCKKNLK